MGWRHILHRRYATGVDIVTLEADGHVASAASMLCMVCIIVNKSRLNKNAMLKLVGSVNVCLLSNERVNVQSLFELLNQVAWFLMHVCSGSAIVTSL